MRRFKKSLGTFIFVGLFSVNVIAEIPNGTVILNNKAYDLELAMNKEYKKEISKELLNSKHTYIKDFSGNWIDNLTGKEVGIEEVPRVIYYGKDGLVKKFSYGDGQELSKEFKVHETYMINNSQLKIELTREISEGSIKDISIKGVENKNISKVEFGNNKSELIINLEKALTKNEKLIIDTSKLEDKGGTKIESKKELLVIAEKSYDGKNNKLTSDVSVIAEEVKLNDIVTEGQVYINSKNVEMTGNFSKVNIINGNVNLNKAYIEEVNILGTNSTLNIPKGSGVKNVNKQGNQIEIKGQEYIGISKPDGIDTSAPVIGGGGGGYIPPAENQAPVVSDVSINGVANLNETLKGVYKYSDAENDAESDSVYKWYRADDVNGKNLALIAEKTLEYKIQEEDLYKYIFFEVTPKSKNGKEGKAIRSLSVGPVKNAELNYKCEMSLSRIGESGAVAENSEGLYLKHNSSYKMNLNLNFGEENVAIDKEKLEVKIDRYGQNKIKFNKDNMQLDVLNGGPNIWNNRCEISVIYDGKIVLEQNIEIVKGDIILADIKDYDGNVTIDSYQHSLRYGNKNGEYDESRTTVYGSYEGKLILPLEKNVNEYDILEVLVLPNNEKGAVINANSKLIDLKKSNFKEENGLLMLEDVQLQKPLIKVTSYLEDGKTLNTMGDISISKKLDSGKLPTPFRINKNGELYLADFGDVYWEGEKTAIILQGREDYYDKIAESNKVEIEMKDNELQEVNLIENKKCVIGKILTTDNKEFEYNYAIELKDIEGNLIEKKEGWGSNFILTKLEQGKSYIMKGYPIYEEGLKYGDAAEWAFTYEGNCVENEIKFTEPKIQGKLKDKEHGYQINGDITLVLPSGKEIKINDSWMYSFGSFEAIPGEYILRASAYGYKNYEEKIIINEGDTLPIVKDISLEKAKYNYGVNITAITEGGGVVENSYRIFLKDNNSYKLNLNLGEENATIDKEKLEVIIDKYGQGQSTINFNKDNMQLDIKNISEEFRNNEFRLEVIYDGKAIFGRGIKVAAGDIIVADIKDYEGNNLEDYYQYYLKEDGSIGTTGSQSGKLIITLEKELNENDTVELAIMPYNEKGTTINANSKLIDIKNATITKENGLIIVEDIQLQRPKIKVVSYLEDGESLNTKGMIGTSKDTTTKQNEIRFFISENGELYFADLGDLYWKGEEKSVKIKANKYMYDRNIAESNEVEVDMTGDEFKEIKLIEKKKCIAGAIFNADGEVFRDGYTIELRDSEGNLIGGSIYGYYGAYYNITGLELGKKYTLKIRSSNGQLENEIFEFTYDGTLINKDIDLKPIQ